MASDASQLTFNRRLSDAERWNIVEKLLLLRDSKSKNLLQQGALTKVSQETGVTTNSVSKIWRTFCLKTAVSGKPDVSRNKGQGRKPRFSTEELRRRIREVPVEERSSLRKIAKKAGLPVNQVKRALRLGVLKTTELLPQDKAEEKQQKEGVEVDASAQAGPLVSQGEGLEGEDLEFDEYDAEEAYEGEEVYEAEEEEEEEEVEAEAEATEYLIGSTAGMETEAHLQQRALTNRAHSLVDEEPLPTETLATAPAAQSNEPARLQSTQNTAFAEMPDKFGRQGFPAAAAAPGTALGEGRRATAGGFLHLLRQQAGDAAREVQEHHPI